MKVVAIIQARMSSTRLPGKVLKEILNKPILSHVIERLKSSTQLNEIVVATSSLKEDQPIFYLAQKHNISVFRGSEKDVLDRYYQAAKKVGADLIVRITADCPLIDPVLTDQMIQFYQKQGNDCDWLGLDSSCLEGVGGEVFSFAALEKSWKEAKKPSEREHVTPYVWNHPEIFKLKRMQCPSFYEPYTQVQFSVDEEDDLVFVREIFKNLYREGTVFLTKEIVALLQKKPELLKINLEKILQAGYLKSLAEDEKPPIMNLKMVSLDRICLGTAQFGMPYGIASKTARPSYSEAKKIIEHAIQNGISFFDTAQDYGESEEILGKVFQELKTSSIKVISKLHPNYSFESQNQLEEVVRASLKKLRLPSLWGLLLHRANKITDVSGFFQAVHKLKEKGFIQHFGVSLYQPEDALFYLNHEAAEILQVPFNILDRRLLDNHFFDQAREKNKTVFIRSIYLQGLLLMPIKEIPSTKLNWALPYLKELHLFTESHGLELKHFALQSVLKTLSDVKVVVGVDNLNQLRENLEFIAQNEMNDKVISEWWGKLPHYPEKLLNPALWT